MNKKHTRKYHPTGSNKHTGYTTMTKQPNSTLLASLPLLSSPTRTLSNSPPLPHLLIFYKYFATLFNLPSTPLSLPLKPFLGLLCDPTTRLQGSKAQRHKDSKAIK